VRLQSPFIWIILHCLILAISVGPAFSSVFPKDNQGMSSENHSGDQENKPPFTAGFGNPVGEIMVSSGNVVIMHKKDHREYRAEKGLPLYNNDTLITGKDGKVRFSLNDGSIITLASSTKLIIDKSIYKPKQQRRSSFIRMVIGKARFFVTKIFAFKEKDFKVKTNTFVAGVRGSDFIIIATKTTADLTALKNTSVEVTGLFHPDKSIIVNDYQRTIVPKGQPPGAVTDVPMDEVKTLQKTFDLKDGDEGEKDDDVSRDNTKNKKGNDAPDDDTDTLDTRVPADALVPPGSIPEPEYGYEPEEPVYIQRERALSDGKNDDVNEQITEEVRQGAVDEEELPDMPGTPE